MSMLLLLLAAMTALWPLRTDWRIPAPGWLHLYGLLSSCIPHLSSGVSLSIHTTLSCFYDLHLGAFGDAMQSTRLPTPQYRDTSASACEHQLLCHHIGRLPSLLLLVSASLRSVLIASATDSRNNALASRQSPTQFFL